MFFCSCWSRLWNVLSENYSGLVCLFRNHPKRYQPLTEPSRFEIVDANVNGNNTFDPDSIKLVIAGQSSSANPNRLVESDSVTKEDIAEVFMVLNRKRHD